MAIFKVLNAAGKYSDPQALEEVIAYITQPCKTPHHFIGGIGIDLNNIAQSMEKVSIKFGKNSGVRVRHFVLSFLPNELNSYNHIVSIAEQICNFIANEYQIVYAIHEDTANLHIHFVFNPISYVTGKRYRADKKAHYSIRAKVWAALIRYRIEHFFEAKYYPDAYCPHE